MSEQTDSRMHVPTADEARQMVLDTVRDELSTIAHVIRNACDRRQYFVEYGIRHEDAKMLIIVRLQSLGYRISWTTGSLNITISWEPNVWTRI